MLSKIWFSLYVKIIFLIVHILCIYFLYLKQYLINKFIFIERQHTNKLSSYIKFIVYHNLSMLSFCSEHYYSLIIPFDVSLIFDEKLKLFKRTI